MTQTRAHARILRPTTAAAALCATGALLVATACSSDAGDQGSASAPSSTTSAAASAASADLDALAAAQDCAPTDDELVELTTFGSAEPIVRLPVPPGWERSTLMDSELIRGAFGNADHMVGEIAPVVTVIVEDLTGIATGAADGIEREIAAMPMGGIEVAERAPTTVCGLPAERVTGTGGAPNGTVIDVETVIAIYETDSSLYAVLVNATRETEVAPQGPRDQQAMLEQVQILPTGGQV